MPPLRSFRTLKKEVRNLKEFYGITLSTYNLTKEVTNKLPSCQGDFEKHLRTNGVLSKRRARHRINKESGQSATESMLRELVLVRAISALEIFLGDTIRDVFVVTKVPFMDPGVEISFTHEDLIANNSPTKIFNRIINKELRKISGGSFNDVIKYYKKRFNIDIGSISPGYQVMNEYHDMRNILVHRLGKTDAIFRHKYRTEEQRININSRVINSLLDDIENFANKVEIQISDLVQRYVTTGSIHNARLVVDIQFYQQEVPNFLLPNYQYWAHDEYVVMSDILLGTSPSVDGKTRYYFTGSDNALKQLRSNLKRAHKREIICLSLIIDLVFTRKNIKDMSEYEVKSVEKELPLQPWSTGIHKEIAADLGMSNQDVSSAISTLIARGVFQPQFNGKVGD